MEPQIASFFAYLCTKPSKHTTGCCHSEEHIDWAKLQQIQLGEQIPTNFELGKLSTASTTSEKSPKTDSTYWKNMGNTRLSSVHHNANNIFEGNISLAILLKMVHNISKSFGCLCINRWELGSSRNKSEGTAKSEGRSPSTLMLTEFSKHTSRLLKWALNLKTCTCPPAGQ